MWRFRDFIHLFRNSIDHGIEQASIRQKLGKEEQGVISIQLIAQDERGVKLRYFDDGSGINIATLESRYKELHGGASASVEDYAELIFRSGLSTSNNVNEISGRGVGMEAVKNSLRT